VVAAGCSCAYVMPPSHSADLTVMQAYYGSTSFVDVSVRQLQVTCLQVTWQAGVSMQSSMCTGVCLQE
jgi:hypothetical protein